MDAAHSHTDRRTGLIPGKKPEEEAEALWAYQQWESRAVLAERNGEKRRRQTLLTIPSVSPTHGWHVDSQSLAGQKERQRMKCGDGRLWVQPSGISREALDSNPLSGSYRVVFSGMVLGGSPAQRKMAFQQPQIPRCVIF